MDFILPVERTRRPCEEPVAPGRAAGLRPPMGNKLIAIGEKRVSSETELDFSAFYFRGIVSFYLETSIAVAGGALPSKL
jgi:hypothetical protein